MICNESKRTISVSGGLRLLQMISESATERCVNKNAGPLKRVDVRSHISWRGERNISYKGMKTSP